MWNLEQTLSMLETLVSSSTKLGAELDGLGALLSCEPVSTHPPSRCLGALWFGDHHSQMAMTPKMSLRGLGWIDIINANITWLD